MDNICSSWILAFRQWTGSLFCPTRFKSEESFHNGYNKMRSKKGNGENQNQCKPSRSIRPTWTPNIPVNNWRKKLKRLTLKKRDREHFKIRNFISSLLRLAKRVKRPQKSNSWNPIVELELKIRAESARAALRCAAIDVHLFFNWSANCVRNIKSTRISIDLHYSGDVIAVRSMNTTQTCSLDSIKITQK